MKRKAEDDLARDKLETKKRKLWEEEEIKKEAKQRWDEDSDLSENVEEGIIYDINDLLAPQDKLILRKDPYGKNFMATTWTNESTLLRKNSAFAKWLATPAELYIECIIPKDIFQEIILYCGSDTLFCLRRVSKFMNGLIIESHQIWRKLFYQRYWRLRHDIDNYFVGTDPDGVDKTDWDNDFTFCPHEDVDWFGEYHRNHVNAVLIKQLMEEINQKLQKIADQIAVPREGVTEPSFFEKGKTDEEIDESDCHIYVTNDLRELLKVADSTRICFPVLEELSKSWSWPQDRVERLEAQFYFTQDLVENEKFSKEIRLDRPSGPDLPLQLNENDMLSDSEDYIPSDQETSVDSDEDDSIEEISKKKISCTSEDEGDYTYFSPKSPMTRFKRENGAWNEKEYQEKQLYSTNDAYLRHTSENNHYYIHDSIVTYLQRISDTLDFEHAIDWLEFEDYAIHMDYKWTYEDYALLEHAHIKDVNLSAWNYLINEIIWQNYANDEGIVLRATKMLAAAAQEFLIKLFAKAQQLETTDAVQPETLIAAAGHVCPELRHYKQRRTKDEDLEKLDKKVIDL